MTSLKILLALLWTISSAQAQTTEPCQVAVDNLVRWSHVSLSSQSQAQSLESCRAAVSSGEHETIEAVRCLSRSELDDAVHCMLDSIMEIALSECGREGAAERVEACRSEVSSRTSALEGQLAELIRSGRVLQGVEPTTLPEPPTDPGSCIAVIDHVTLWAGQERRRRARKKAIADCESELTAENSDTQLVVMCLSLPSVDQASDCLVTEAIRANISECASTNAQEEAMCIQMLIGMMKPMKAELREAILDGSLME